MKTRSFKTGISIVVLFTVLLCHGIQGDQSQFSLSIHEAAKRGDIANVQALLERGVAVNQKDPGGSTALHYASKNGHKKLVEFLISKGANVNAITSGGGPLADAARTGHVDVVELLIGAGADLTIRSAGGFTVLHEVAAFSGSKQIAELLITNGVDVNAITKYRQTALHFAVRENHKDLVELLLAKGADVNIRGEENKTALHFAVEKRHKDLVEMLLAKGAQVAIKDEDGCTPLHLASLTDQKDVVTLLKLKSLNMNAIDNLGEIQISKIKPLKTPLHIATVFIDSKSIVEYSKADLKACYQFEKALRDGYEEDKFIISETKRDAEILIIAKQIKAKYATWTTVDYRRNPKGNVLGVSGAFVIQSTFDVIFIDNAGKMLENIRVKASWDGFSNSLNNKAIEKVINSSKRIFVLRNTRPNDNPHSQMKNMNL